MKKRILYLLIIVILVIGFTGCKNKKQEENKDNEVLQSLSEKEIISCLEEKVGGFLLSEKDEFTEIPLSEIIPLDDEIVYYKGAYVNKDKRYVIVKTNFTYDRDVMKYFELYFSNKYETYYSYEKNGIYVYFHNNSHDVDIEEFNQCFINNNSSVNLKEKDMNSKIIKKLNKTNKIVIKIGNKELGTIKDNEKINEILELVSNSKQYGEAFLCDGHSFNFEFYNEKNKLIETIFVWYDGGRLLPSSIHNGCSYYSIANRERDFRKIIEEETNYIFFGLSNYNDDEENENELIYEDDNYYYYLKGRKSDKLLITFALTGLNMNIKYALDNNYIDIKSLLSYEELIIKVEKNG